eukprot:3212376-Amphidinium_carterae.4
MALGTDDVDQGLIWCWPVFGDEEEKVLELEEMREEMETETPHDESLEPPSHVKQAIHHLHCNLGHPTKTALLRIMRRGGAKNSILKWVRSSYSCASCMASTRPSPHNPATAGTTYTFNHIVVVDLFHMDCPFRHPDRRDVQLLSCLCWGTNFMVIAEVSTKTAEATYEAFAKCWLQYFSFPKILICDQGGEFDG